MHEKGKLRSNQFRSALKISRLLPGNQILLALLASGLIGHSLSLLKSCNYLSEILPLTCIIKTLALSSLFRRCGRCYIVIKTGLVFRFTTKNFFIVTSHQLEIIRDEMAVVILIFFIFSYKDIFRHL